MTRKDGSLVPDADFRSYYGRPILKPPAWKEPDVPLYLFLGGVAGASAVLAEGAAAITLAGGVLLSFVGRRR